MKRRKTHQQWLDVSNDNQLQFTKQFLQKKSGYTFPPLTNDSQELFNQLIQELEYLDSQPTGQHLIEKLRQEWRNNKSYKNPDYKGLSIRISQITYSHLKHMAKGQSMNHFIEAMIMDRTDIFKELKTRLKEYEDEKRENYKKHKEQLTKKYESKNIRSQKELAKLQINQELIYTKDELKILKTKCIGLIDELTRLHVISSRETFAYITPNESEKERIIAKAKELKAEYLGEEWITIQKAIDSFDTNDLQEQPETDAVRNEDPLQQDSEPGTHSPDLPIEQAQEGQIDLQEHTTDTIDAENSDLEFIPYIDELENSNSPDSFETNETIPDTSEIWIINEDGTELKIVEQVADSFTTDSDLWDVVVLDDTIESIPTSNTTTEKTSNKSPPD